MFFLKNDLKRAEDKIKEFFITEEKLKVLNKTIASLESRKENILEKIQSLNFEKDYDVKGVSFEAIRIQGCNKTSYFEATILGQISKYEKMVNDINEELLELKMKVEKLELEQNLMLNIFSVFSEEYLSIIEMKYKKKHSQTTISNRLSVSEKTYQRYKKNILQTVHNMLILHEDYTV